MDNKKLDELRRYYDETNQADEIAASERDDRVYDEVMVSTSIRLPRSLMLQIRQRAEAAGVPATTLMRQWVVDRRGAAEGDAVVSVIAERAHPAA
jgi:hypothetical protein